MPRSALRQQILSKIDSAIAESGMSDRKVSLLATGNPEAMRNIRRGCFPRIDTLEALCNVLDLRIEMYRDADLETETPGCGTAHSLPISSIADALHHRLQARVDEHGLRGTARALGIPLSQVRGFIDGRDPRLGNATRMANALGFRLTLVPNQSDTIHRFGNLKPDAQLLHLVAMYCKQTGLSEATVGSYSAGQSYVFERLRNGKTITFRRYEKILDWFRTNWPEDLIWPADIPQPKVIPMPKNKPDFAGSRNYVPATKKTPRRIRLPRLLPKLSPEKRIALGTIWMLVKALFSQRYAEEIDARADNLAAAEQLQKSLASQGPNQPTKH